MRALRIGTLAIASGTQTYTMPVDTIDIIEHHIRTGTGTSQIDTALERVSVSTYANQSNKNTTTIVAEEGLVQEKKNDIV